MSLGQPKPPPGAQEYAPPREGPPCERCRAATPSEPTWRDGVFGHPLCGPCFRDYCRADGRPERVGLAAALEMGPVRLKKAFEAEQLALRAWTAAWIARGRT